MSQVEKKCHENDVNQTLCQAVLSENSLPDPNVKGYKSPRQSDSIVNNFVTQNGFSHEPSDGNSTTSMPSSVSPNFAVLDQMKKPRNLSINPIHLFLCQTCGRKFRIKARLIIHEKKHSRCPFICTRCGSAFASTADLIKHRSLKMCQDPSLNNNLSKSFIINCIIRNRCLPDLMSTDYHKNYLRIQCSLCPDHHRLPNIYSYQIHMKRTHPSEYNQRQRRRRLRRKKVKSSPSIHPTTNGNYEKNQEKPGNTDMERSADYQSTVDDFYDTDMILNKAIDSLLPECFTGNQEPITDSQPSPRQTPSSDEKEAKSENHQGKTSEHANDDEGVITSSDNLGESTVKSTTILLLIQEDAKISSTSTLPDSECILEPVKTPSDEKLTQSQEKDSVVNEAAMDSETIEETYLYLSTNENGEPEIVEGPENWQGRQQQTTTEQVHEQQQPKNETEVQPAKVIKNETEESVDMNALPVVSSYVTTPITQRIEDEKPKMKTGAYKKRQKMKQIVDTMVKIDENGEIIKTMTLPDGLDMSTAVALANGTSITGTSGGITPLDRKGRPCSFPCPACPRRFAFQCRLAAHLRCHTNIRPFMCLECGRAFTQKGYLARHAAVHRVDRPFLCRICNRSYKHYGSLVNHRRTHTRSTTGPDGTEQSVVPESNSGETLSLSAITEGAKAILVNGQTVILSESKSSPAVGAPKTVAARGRGRNLQHQQQQQQQQTQSIFAQQAPHQQQILLSSAPQSNMIITPVMDPNQFQLTAARALAASTTATGQQQLKQQHQQQQQQQHQQQVTNSTAANILANLNGQIYVTPEGLVYTGNAVNFQTVQGNTAKPMIIQQQHTQNQQPQQHQAFITSTGQQILPINKIEDVLTAVQLEQQTFGQQTTVQQHQQQQQQAHATSVTPTIHLYSTSNQVHHQSNPTNATSTIDQQQRLSNAGNALAAIHSLTTTTSTSHQQQQQQQQHLANNSNNASNNNTTASSLQHAQQQHQHQQQQQQQQPTIITIGQIQAAINNSCNNVVNSQQQHQQITAITSQANQQLQQQQQQHLLASHPSLTSHHWQTFTTNDSGQSDGTSGNEQQQQQTNLIQTSDGQTAMLTCLPVTFTTTTGTIADQLSSAQEHHHLHQQQQQQQQQQHLQQQQQFHSQHDPSSTHQIQHQNQVFHFLQSGSNGTQSIVTLPGYYLPTLASANITTTSTTLPNSNNNNNSNSNNANPNSTAS